jgi:hypothetical protein
VLFAEVVNSNSFCPFLFLLFALIFIFYSGKKKFVWVKPGQVPSLAGPWIRLWLEEINCLNKSQLLQ